MIKMFDSEDGENNAEVKLADVKIHKCRVFCTHPDAQEFRKVWSIYTKFGHDLIDNSKW